MTERPRNRRMLIVPAVCVATVMLMVGAAYAAVPLYNLFCAVTGFGGTPSIANVEALPAIEQRDRVVTVRFDANVAPGLPWTFRPEQRTMKVHVGEIVEATYLIENVSPRRTVGSTTYNVSPYQAGGYFTKIQCFCFNTTALGPRETQEIKVVFYVDPAFDDDPDADGVNVITLSYTFFPTPEGAAPAEG